MLSRLEPYSILENLNRLDGLSECAAIDNIGVVDAVARLSQRVVIAVALASHRQLGARFRPPFNVTNRKIPRTQICIKDQTAVSPQVAARGAIFPSP